MATLDPRTLPKILYVDDTPDARRLVSRVLSQCYVVLEASDGLSGIELALDTQPDLILLDINLPQLSGREMATRLKTLLPSTPLVAFSADVSPEARQRALAAGFSGYLTKPIEDLDQFIRQIGEFLRGKRESVPNLRQAEQAYTAEVAARLEENVRELTKTVERNHFLNEQNTLLIAALQRRQRLLEAAARVSHVVTSILELNELLDVAVFTICKEYGFASVTIYLTEGEQLAFGAGCDSAGSIAPRAVSQLVEAAARERCPQLHREAQAILALPLILRESLAGVLLIQSDQSESFAEEDMPALQSLADQIAIAINNARLLHDLSRANQELLRSKTYEAIATATGEAIHWVGNKAAPIPASAIRVQEDLLSLALAFRILLDLPPHARVHHPLWPSMEAALTAVKNIPSESCHLLPKHIDSMLEDLTIIEQSAATILNVKEDLIGPARRRTIAEVNIPALLAETLFQMGLPDGVAQTQFEANLPPVRGDARQLGQVFNNLIKNAWEALQGRADPQIVISARGVEDPRGIQVAVADNGPGIPPEMLDRIWVSFFTTKGDRGGTGLGLSACMTIVNQHQGKMNVESQPGQGAVFRVTLPLDETIEEE